LGLQGDAQEPVAHYTAKRRLMMNVVSFRARPSPVRALFVLGRRLPIGQPTRSRTLQARDRLMALAPYACVMDVTDRRQLSQMFSELSQLVTEVPVVRLRLGEKRKLLDCADDVLALTRTLAIR
jgi:hypothetical protein